MHGLRCTKTLTYLTASVDGYLMVSSSRYRRHFQEEIKSSFAILLWILSGVYQVVMVMAGFGKHMYDCQLGLCVFQLQNSRSFIVVYCINTLVILLSIITSVAAVRKGRKKASLVAPFPKVEDAGPSTNPNKVIELKSGSTECMQNSNYDVHRIHTNNEFEMDNFLPNCIPQDDLSSQIGNSLCQSIACDKYDEVFCVDVENRNVETKKEEIQEMKNASAGETKIMEKAKTQEYHPNESFCDLVGEVDNIEPEKNKVITSGGKLPEISVIQSLSNETPRSNYLDLTPSVICFEEISRHIAQRARQNPVSGRSLLKCYSHVFAHLLSLLIFALCWEPYHITLILESVFNVQCPRGIRFALMWLGLVSGILNVIVYPCFHFVLNKNFRILWKQLYDHITVPSSNMKANDNLHERTLTIQKDEREKREVHVET